MNRQPLQAAAFQAVTFTRYSDTRRYCCADPPPESGSGLRVAPGVRRHVIPQEQ
ncbi:MAG: hypothetical protein LBH43_10230 [Treponema sp.]|nr:hypothetical protein [Treponema sp.]